MSTIPKVTVIIALYNQGEYLEECIDSVLSQTYKDYEIIVVNDGSTDPYTTELLKTYRPDKTTILHKENGHLSSARNYGIERAPSPYILILDADDKFEATFIEKAVDFLDNNPEFGVCTCLQQNFGENTDLGDPGGGDVYDFLADNHCLGNCLIRRECWIQAGGYDETMKSGYEDWNFWIGVTKNGWKVHVINEGLFLYRIKKHSMSIESEKQRPELVRRIVENHIDLYRDNVAAVIQEKEYKILHLQERIRALENEKNKN